MMAGAAARARRGAGAGAGEARRLLPRFPRRHRPPLDDGDPRRARHARAVPAAAAQPRRPRARSAGTAGLMTDRRPHPPQHARAVHRDDAAVGIPRFPARRGGGLSRLRAADGGRRSTASSRRAGASPGCGWRTGERAARRQAGDRWPTGAVRSCAPAMLPLEVLGAPMDVFWFARAQGDKPATRCAAASPATG